MSSVAVIGTGYVGLTTAVCLAEIGHQVTGVDIDEAKIALLRAGTPTIYEPGLDELLTSSLKSGRLVFTREYEQAIPDADFVFIAVGTPPGRRGEADLHFVKQAAKAVAGATGREAGAIPTTLSAAEMTKVHRTPAGVPDAKRVRPAFVLNDPALCASQPEAELAANRAPTEAKVTTVTGMSRALARWRSRGLK